jgi:hypothetical protein
MRPDVPATCVPPMKWPYSIMFRSLLDGLSGRFMRLDLAHNNGAERASAVRKRGKQADCKECTLS